MGLRLARIGPFRVWAMRCTWQPNLGIVFILLLWYLFSFQQQRK